MARLLNAPLVLLHPCGNIARALGVSENTVYWWAKRYGLPLFHLADGQLAITIGMIEQWARERREAELSEPPRTKPRETSIMRKHTPEKFHRGGRCGAKMKQVA